MKKMNLLFVVLTFLGSSLLAQTTTKTDDKTTGTPICCNGKMWQDIPDLTSEQSKKIEDLQIAHLKEVNQAKNQVAEKRAHLRTLQSAEKVDNAAINKTIDEITALQNDIMKKNEAHRQAVRNLLTDKQKVVFDAKNCGKMHGNKGNCCGGNGHMNGNGYGHQHGQGNGCGEHKGEGQGKGCCKH